MRAATEVVSRELGGEWVLEGFPSQKNAERVSVSGGLESLQNGDPCMAWRLVLAGLRCHYRSGALNMPRAFSHMNTIALSVALLGAVVVCTVPVPYPTIRDPPYPHFYTDEPLGSYIAKEVQPYTTRRIKFDTEDTWNIRLNISTGSEPTSREAEDFIRRLPDWLPVELDTSVDGTDLIRLARDAQCNQIHVCRLRQEDRLFDQMERH